MLHEFLCFLLSTVFLLGNIEITFCNTNNSDDLSLEKGFKNPPISARPRAGKNKIAFFVSKSIIQLHSSGRAHYIFFKKGNQSILYLSKFFKMSNRASLVPAIPFHSH